VTHFLGHVTGWQIFASGLAYVAENKKAMARENLERILAENAGYEGIRGQLGELA
jgi:hypothetical protein